MTYADSRLSSTKEGNWDLVGNNIPVFFIQDAIKFPDLIHAVKMEPDRGFPQSASTHDTFWDFISLTPESMHTVMWIMSDRTIPRSLRMIEGFGVHSFRLMNKAGESTFVKFHWRPKLGLQSTIWDETVKIAGADPDFHRRDMFEAIAAGHFPEWEFAVQLFTQEEADGFPFDHLDATKLIPEELVPLKVIGRMMLDRWPDNFFVICRIKVSTTRHEIRKNDVQHGGIVFYDAVVLLGTPYVNQTEKEVRLVGYCVANVDYWIVTDRHDLSAEQIAFAYKLRWNIEIFFGWWKRHLKVYHLISRNKYGLMVQMLSGLITYILLAIYCHDQHQENVSVKRLREISINIRNEMSIEDIVNQTGLWIYQPPNKDISYANP